MEAVLCVRCVLAREGHMPSHEILGGKVQVYRRSNSPFWQCSASINGTQYRASTKRDSLAQAEEAAEDWYLELRGKSRAGLLEAAPKKKDEKSFAEAADQFLLEYEVITEHQRSPLWVKGHKLRLDLHLRPYFGGMGLSEINAGTVQKYRLWRVEQSKKRAEAAALHAARKKAQLQAAGKKYKGRDPEEIGKPKPPSRSTLHDEVVTLRLVLKTAIRHKWLEHLPDLSPPYKTQGKIVHRPWFTLEEYKKLYKTSGDYARSPAQEQIRWDAEQVHDYILFLGNTGLRPDEALNLQFQDVKMVKDEDSGQLILEIEVRGKRGVGFCKSMPGAVKVFQRLLNRPKWEPQGRAPRTKKERAAAAAREPNAPQLPQPSDLLFPGEHKRMFNRILERAGLKYDRDGNRRTAYSLRHTYICLRLMDGADIYQIAKNCRTSVEMIQKFYAAHL
ncbi:MAG: site-specific integrase, partial [Alphaproteobacteria bacterium]|nr:site-specific integrase [Alphaproteobacteria bacterium]